MSTDMSINKAIQVIRQESGKLSPDQIKNMTKSDKKILQSKFNVKTILTSKKEEKIIKNLSTEQKAKIIDLAKKFKGIDGKTLSKYEGEDEHKPSTGLEKAVKFTKQLFGARVASKDVEASIGKRVAKETEAKTKEDAEAKKWDSEVPVDMKYQEPEFVPPKSLESKLPGADFSKIDFEKEKEELDVFTENPKLTKKTHTDDDFAALETNVALEKELIKKPSKPTSTAPPKSFPDSKILSKAETSKMAELQKKKEAIKASLAEKKAAKEEIAQERANLEKKLSDQTFVKSQIDQAKVIINENYKENKNKFDDLLKLIENTKDNPYFERLYNMVDKSISEIAKNSKTFEERGPALILQGKLNIYKPKLETK